MAMVEGTRTRSDRNEYIEAIVVQRMNVSYPKLLNKWVSKHWRPECYGTEENERIELNECVETKTRGEEKNLLRKNQKEKHEAKKI